MAKATIKSKTGAVITVEGIRDNLRVLLRDDNGEFVPLVAAKSRVMESV